MWARLQTFRREAKDANDVVVNVAFRGNVLCASVAVVRSEFRHFSGPTESLTLASAAPAADRFTPSSRARGPEPRRVECRHLPDTRPGALRSRRSRAAAPCE